MKPPTLHCRTECGFRVGAWGTHFPACVLWGDWRAESPLGKFYEQTRFRFGAEERDLASLTTVHDWADSDRVSRMSFYNPRTDTIDRYSAALDVVVADGEKSFTKSAV